MDISKMPQGKQFNFGQANINIAAFSDTHGQIEKTAAICDTYEKHKEEIHPDSQNKSNKNVLAVVGDWFMNPTRKGYLSFKETIGDMQGKFLGDFIERMKSNTGSLSTLYTPGNHCLEGGDSYLFSKTKQCDMTTVMTNVDIDDSKSITSLEPEAQKKFAEATVLEVPDDKDPDKVHKMLVLGMVCPNMDYYCKGLVDDLDILDRNSKKEVNISEEDLQETYKTFNEKIAQFKEENPNSPVMLLNHAGQKVVQMLCNHCDIDLVLNGHDHKDETSEFTSAATGKKTLVCSLSENAKLMDAVNVHFDDDGKYSFSSKTLYVQLQDQDAKFKEMFDKTFEKDTVGLVQITDPAGSNKLSIGNIRYADNPLAKLVTDTIKEDIKTTHPDTELFMMNTSAFRQEIQVDKDNPVTNMQLMDLMSGLIEKDAKIRVGSFNGETITKMVYQNVRENNQNKTRNVLMGWSGLQFDRGNMIRLQNEGCEDMSEVAKYIKIMNKDGEWEPIDFSRSYKTAVTQKLFEKTTIEDVKNLDSEFEHLGKTANDCLLAGVKKLDYKLTVPQDIRVIDESAEEET
ncbi:MAG: metallophosphoesterase [Candidatus Gastranaerophilales bacterium]|nr:metallophosphoesterase [Candidatus Gastranaerophilales bacterium]